LKLFITGDTRSAVFTPLTLRAFLFQALSSTGSCKEVITHVLIERIGLAYSANSINMGPYCKARCQIATSSFKTSCLTFRSSIAWASFRELVVEWISGYATMLMPDTDNNQKTYPQQSV